MSAMRRLLEDWGMSETDQAQGTEENTSEAPVVKTNGGANTELAQLQSGSGEIRNRLQELKTTIERTYLEMAELLNRVRQDKLFVEWGFDSFENYVEQELGYKRRKAFYILSVWRVLHGECGLTEEQLQAIDFSKAREIARVADQGNIAAWLEKAGSMSARELADEVSKASSKVKGTKEPSYRWVCALTDDQREHVEATLDRAAEVIGKEKGKGAMLDLICMEFQSSALSKDNSDEWLEWHLENLQRVLKVRLSAWRGDEMIFGEKRDGGTKGT